MQLYQFLWAMLAPFVRAARAIWPAPRLVYAATNNNVDPHTGRMPTPYLIRNQSGAALPAFSLVYVSGYDATTGRVLVSLADADAGILNLAGYIVVDPISNNANGVAYKVQLVTGILDTSGASVGDAVYLSATAGAMTLTAPTTYGATQQIIGRVTVASASVGQILVSLEQQSILKRSMRDVTSGGFAFYLVDGQNESTPAITVTGLAAGDEILGCIVYTTKASIASQVSRSPADFTVTANTATVVANATNNTSNQYLFIVRKNS